MDDLETSDKLRESLNSQNTKLSACSGWRPVGPEYIAENFTFEKPKEFTEEDLKQRVLDMFTYDVDPLSKEGLEKRFPNFPMEWYDYISQAANDKFKVIEAEKKKLDEVTKTAGNFKISFN